MRIEEEDRLWYALNGCPGVGAFGLNLLRRHFGSASGVFGASEAEWKAAIPNLSSRAIEFLARKPDYSAIERQWELAQLNEAIMVFPHHPEYPSVLLQDHAPPPILFMQGQWQSSDEEAIAIVGTRTPSGHGRQASWQFGYQLAQMGFTIVSGLAKGIDSLAHLAALKASGRTIAVLGTGIDKVYPQENRPLCRQIAKNGAVLTEIPFQFDSDSYAFAKRNRVISALSRAVLVAEAGEGSGALITANYARKQGKRVLAVPGNIFCSKSAGNHELLMEGTAGLALSAEHIRQQVLEPNCLSEPTDSPSAQKRSPRSNGAIGSIPTKAKAFGIKGRPAPALPDGGGQEAMWQQACPPQGKDEILILDALAQGASEPDELVMKSGLPPQRVLELLLRMELNGIVRHEPGALYSPL